MKCRSLLSRENKGKKRKKEKKKKKQRVVTVNRLAILININIPSVGYLYCMTCRKKLTNCKVDFCRLPYNRVVCPSVDSL